jgi:hypothetical protein
MQTKLKHFKDEGLIHIFSWHYFLEAFVTKSVGKKRILFMHAKN